MRASAEPQCLCFGKLPIAGDFIRGDGVAPEFAELDDWIQHGMYESQQLIGNGFQDRFDALPPARFLWTAGDGPVLAGWWQSSRDAVGRRYPFLLATRLPKVKPADYALLPIALVEFFDDSEQLLDQAFAGLDVVGTIAAAQSLTCRLDLQQASEQYTAALQASPTSAAWAGHTDPAELLLDDLELVAGTAKPPQYSLRWPTRGAAVDASFWLTAMARFGCETPRLLLWHGDGQSPGTARAVLGQLQAKLFAGMIFFDREDHDAYDLGRGAEDQGRLDAARRRFQSAVDTESQAQALLALPTGSR